MWPSRDSLGIKKEDGGKTNLYTAISQNILHSFLSLALGMSSWPGHSEILLLPGPSDWLRDGHLNQTRPTNHSPGLLLKLSEKRCLLFSRIMVWEDNTIPELLWALSASSGSMKQHWRKWEAGLRASFEHLVQSPRLGAPLEPARCWHNNFTFLMKIILVDFEWWKEMLANWKFLSNRIDLGVNSTRIKKKNFLRLRLTHFSSYQNSEAIYLLLGLTYLS